MARGSARIHARAKQHDAGRMGAHLIELRSIAMDPDGSFSAYFDDDDMFFGHCVTAYGTLTDGVRTVNMEG